MFRNVVTSQQHRNDFIAFPPRYLNTELVVNQQLAQLRLLLQLKGFGGGLACLAVFWIWPLGVEMFWGLVEAASIMS